MTLEARVYRSAPDHSYLQRRRGEHRLGRRNIDPPGQLCRIHGRRTKDLDHRSPGDAPGTVGPLLLPGTEICSPNHRQPEAVPAGGDPEQAISSGISEVDELAEFLNARARSQGLEHGELPPNIAELFDQFVARKNLLTESERNILRYYVDGHEIAEIPELAFISMSTVRKHNRSIYEKLGVASRDELMLYIDLLRRCGRLQELI